MVCRFEWAIEPLGGGRITHKRKLTPIHSQFQPLRMKSQFTGRTSRVHIEEFFEGRLEPFGIGPARRKTSPQNRWNARSIQECGPECHLKVRPSCDYGHGAPRISRSTTRPPPISGSQHPTEGMVVGGQGRVVSLGKLRFLWNTATSENLEDLVQRCMTPRPWAPSAIWKTPLTTIGWIQW